MASANIFDLTGKVVLVTGGNGGIGLGMATGLANAGATTIVWGRNAEKNEAALSALAACRGSAFAEAVDITNESAVREGVAAIIARHGRLDAVFANAARAQPSVAFVGQQRELWDKIFATNLWGVRATLQAAAEHMIQRAKAGDPGGSLVVVSSLAGMRATPFNEAYGVSKAASLSLSQQLASALARYGVRSNAIVPGGVVTAMTRAVRANQEAADAFVKKVPMRRWGEPEDFAAIAVYLASDGSRYHSGDAFVIDGAMSASL